MGHLCEAHDVYVIYKSNLRVAEGPDVFLKRAVWCLGVRCSLFSVLPMSGGWMELRPLCAGGGGMQA